MPITIRMRILARATHAEGVKKLIDLLQIVRGTKNVYGLNRDLV